MYNTQTVLTNCVDEPGLRHFCVCMVVSVCITLITVTVYNTHRQCRVCTNPVFVSAQWCLCVSPSSLLLCITRQCRVCTNPVFVSAQWCLHSGVCMYHPHHCYCVQHTHRQCLYEPCFCVCTVVSACTAPMPPMSWC